MEAADDVRIEHVAADGSVTVLKESTPLLAGEIIDATVMSKAALLAFLEEQVAAAKAEGILFSLHMKATMMKVSDPIIFGHCVEVFFKDLIAKHADVVEAHGVDFNNGFGDLVAKIPADQRAEIEADIAAAYGAAPDLAMVNSDLGITNLHVPSDIIIDASMPAMIRTSGQMWNADGKQQDTLARDPGQQLRRRLRCHDRILQEARCLRPDHHGHGSECRPDGAEGGGIWLARQDLRVPGAMAWCASSSQAGETLIEHSVREGDIWRACQVKDAPVQDWVKLAVNRARATGTPAIFWLDESRAHDAQIIKKVEHLSQGSRYRRARYPDHVAGRGHRVHARADPPGRRHDHRDRQRPARLSHRPVPDPRARHQRQDALDRPADEWRWPFRDRCGWLGPEARAAVRGREPSALGLARRIPRAGSLARASRRALREPEGNRPRRRRSTTQPPNSCSPTRARRAKRASSTTAAATSTSPSIGRRRSPPRTTMPNSRPRSHNSPPTSQPPRTRSSRNSPRCRAPGRYRRLLPARRDENHRSHAPERTLNNILACRLVASLAAATTHKPEWRP